LARSFFNKTMINSVGPAHYNPKINIGRPNQTRASVWSSSRSQRKGP